MQRKASAVWKGGLKDGQGSLSAPGGALNNTKGKEAQEDERKCSKDKK